MVESDVGGSSEVWKLRASMQLTSARAHNPLPDRTCWVQREAGMDMPTPPLPPRLPGKSNSFAVGARPQAWHHQHCYSGADLFGPFPDPPVFNQSTEVVPAHGRNALSKVSTPPTLERGTGRLYFTAPKTKTAVANNSGRPKMRITTIRRSLNPNLSNWAFGF